MAGIYDWRPEWRRLTGDEVLSEAELRERLDYCLEWRAWLWRDPAVRLLTPFHRFAGQRVLDFGARFGRMSCLFAAAGARVTGLDIAASALEQAREEAKRWGVENRTTFVAYDGSLEKLPDGPFDVVFSKSVMVMLPPARLLEWFQGFKKRMAPGGVALLLENRNSPLLDWIRRNIVHRRQRCWDRVSWGFYPEQLELMRQAFGSLDARLHRRLLWEIRAGGAR